MVKEIVAFDIGDKRIGVAFSDPFGEYAMPSDTYFRTGNFSEDVRAVARIAAERGAKLIVCGLPINADGTPSVQTERTERFVSALMQETTIPVVFEDERYTTREARRDLVQMGISAKKDKKKKNIDSLAAAYILEGYLSKIKKGENVMMKEERNDYDEENNIVELVDEEGNTLRYEHLMTFEYRGGWYCAFTPEEAPEAEGDEDEGEEVAIFRLTGEEDDEHLEIIEDEHLLDEVFAEFCNLYEDSEDADDAQLLDDDN